jgi:hypothetical protein
MAFLTTNPSPFIINIPELQNVQTSATGSGGLASLSNTVNDILNFVNTTNSQVNVNTIGSQTTGSVTFSNNINLSNSIISFLGSNLLGSNVLNGPANFLAFQVNGIEQARLTTTGFGIGTSAPSAKLSVNGNALITSNIQAGNAYISNSVGIGTSAPAAQLHVVGDQYVTSTIGIGTTGGLVALDASGNAIVRGTLYVSSIGAAAPYGDIIADGDLYANGNFYPSDPSLKTNVLPYTPIGLPDPVEFTWRSTGERDIGVLANQLADLEPACVKRAPNGNLHVDYGKLCVLLLAEIKSLKAEMTELRARLP